MDSSKIRIAIIGGTGFSDGLGQAELLHFETSYGVAQLSIYGTDVGIELVFVPRHGAGHRMPPHKINHRASIATLQEIGVSGVFATAAVGSLQKEIAPGDFVVLDDFIDMTKGDVVTFFDRPGDVRHTAFDSPFDTNLRNSLLATTDKEASYTVHPTGTYLCLSGPRYETRAEVRLYSSWGASVVGMTVAPEAILCREANLPYACVATVTNYGCGLAGKEVLTHQDVEKMMAGARDALVAWVLRAIRAVV
jgi:5'-methylthioadenosine phosphorylase